MSEYLAAITAVQMAMWWSKQGSYQLEVLDAAVSGRKFDMKTKTECQARQATVFMPDIGHTRHHTCLRCLTSFSRAAILFRWPLITASSGSSPAWPDWSSPSSTKCCRAICSSRSAFWSRSACAKRSCSLVLVSSYFTVSCSRWHRFLGMQLQMSKWTKATLRRVTELDGRTRADDCIPLTCPGCMLQLNAQDQEWKSHPQVTP